MTYQFFSKTLKPLDFTGVLRDLKIAKYDFFNVKYDKFNVYYSL